MEANSAFAMLQQTYKHCDDFIRDKTQPKALRVFLLYHRIPALWQCKWRARGWPVPSLYANRPKRRGPGGGYKKAGVFRVTMASRFGDVGITDDLTQESGYLARVNLALLTDFRAEP